ncbi:MAG: asparaginase [Thauera sp.]|jgi:L-asparaginase|nr:asparaginase [Thauera sp.]
MRKRVLLLTTGGTIASVLAQEGRSAAGVLDAAALAAMAPFGSDIELQAEAVLQKQSSAIDDQDWLLLGRRCLALTESGEFDGIVITHGTDTLEETAYFLDCVLDTTKVAVVVTGSQRTPQAPGSDVATNLGSAIAAAASVRCRGLGVVVAFNESLFSARFVRKVSSFRVDGFDAPLWGCLGLLDHRLPAAVPAPLVMQRPQALPRLPLPAVLPRVDVIAVHAGARVEMLAAVLASGPAGVVIEGLGRGHVPPAWLPVLCEGLAAGVAMVLCSATLHGGTAQSYQFDGSLHSLEQAGVVGVSHLSARKARARLALLLAAGRSEAADLRAAFCWAGEGEQGSEG